MPNFANPQSLNRYAYVINNPLRYTDPTGHLYVIDDDENGNPIVWHPPSNSGGGGGGNDDDDNDGDDGGVLGGLPELNLGISNLIATAYSHIYNNLGYFLSRTATTGIPSQSIQWCDLLDCVLSGAGFLSSAFTFAQPPVDLIATGVDLVATVWSIGRTEDDYSQGEISDTRRWLLHGTAVVGLAPAWLGPPVGFIGAGASFFNLLITATGIPN